MLRIKERGTFRQDGMCLGWADWNERGKHVHMVVVCRLWVVGREGKRVKEDGWGGKAGRLME